MKIAIDYEKCSGCKICEQICTFSHEKEFNPRRARIKVVHTVREGLSIPKTCNQCQECISVCPEEAIYWDDELGTIRVDADRCSGCGICVDSCEQTAIFIDPVTGKANICDLCGGDPQCVKWCPEEVLQCS